jgi:hypothetical protein
MQQRRASGMNDVAFGNWRSDYGGFLRQLQPQQTTGWWRVGDRSELFGRFARGWAAPTDKSAVISMELDKGLWGGLPFTSARHSQGHTPSLSLRLVFLDRGTGAISA